MIRAESMLAFAVAEHNLPFSIADHFSDIVKKMFPANQIAAKFACIKTKKKQRNFKCTSIYNEFVHLWVN